MLLSSIHLWTVLFGVAGTRLSLRAYLSLSRRIHCSISPTEMAKVNVVCVDDKSEAERDGTM